MIEISPASAAMLYLSITLALLFILWLYQHWKRHRRKPFLDREELYVCEYCHFIYLADPEKPNNRCPECLSYNKHNRYRNTR